MKILGIHSGVTISQHDPGAVLLIDGVVVAAIEEERLIRVKGARSFLPIKSISACLKEANISIEDIDVIAHAGASFEDMPDRIRNYMVHYFGSCPEIHMVNHQMAHLASAYYCSGMDEAICISWDGYGDSLSAAFAVANRESGIKVLETKDISQSLGNFYAALTSFIGFDAGEDEFKVMGLAPYGNNRLDLSRYLKASADGYEMNDGFYRKDPPLKSRLEPMYSDELKGHLGLDSRAASEPISQVHKDIAFSAQKILEDVMSSVIEKLVHETGLKKVCIAGGVALNCSANGFISQLDYVDDLFIQPAASDRGLPLGCALDASAKKGIPVHSFPHVYLGTTITASEIQRALELTGNSYELVDNPEEVAAKMLADGKIIGWFQGRSEYGPRALGNRSILANPTIPSMKDSVNSRIKFREEFRPFAPAVLVERSFDIFDIDKPWPFMTAAFKVKDGWIDRLPATTHVNGTARVQTVDRSDNARFYGLIEEFEKLTSVPVVLNTSFNIRGQPIVETPFDAISTFFATGLDALIMGNYVLTKSNPCLVQ